MRKLERRDDIQAAAGGLVMGKNTGGTHVMKKSFTAFIATLAATLWFGASFVIPTRTQATEPVLLHAIWIAIDVKGAVQIARIH